MAEKPYDRLDGVIWYDGSKTRANIKAAFFRRRGGEEPGFRAPAAALVVPLALGFCLWLLSTRTFAQAWILGLLMLAGWGLGRAARFARGRTALTSPGR